MKKLLVAIFCMFLVACTSTNNTSISKDQDGNIKVENPNEVKITQDKIITIPFSFFQTYDENLTKEDIIKSLENDASENAAIKSTEVTDDGVTFVIDGQQYASFLNEMRDAVNQSIQEIIDVEEYGITKIEYDQNMTKFIVTINTDEINFYQQLSTILLFMQGSYYQMFEGINQSDINVTVEFINADGTVLTSSSLKE